MPQPFGLNGLVPLPPLADSMLSNGGNSNTLPASQLFSARSLRDGCYLINFTPSTGALVTYDGTLRVERTDGGVATSGDLYQRQIVQSAEPPFAPALPAAPSPSGGLPILALGQYRYYLRVTQILDSESVGFDLVFELWRYIPTSRWANEGGYSAQMKAKTGSSFPPSADYYEGAVTAVGGSDSGRLTIRWVSTYLRQATVEIGRVAASEAPTANGSGMTWQSVFDALQWNVTLQLGDATIPDTNGESWSDAELHAAMLDHRAKVDLDSEWHYYVLAVPHLASTDRGIMFDAGATDSNNVPREGAAVASHWIIPNDDLWGLVKAQRVGTVHDVYFRTAVHEIGHAMGLFHNSVDNGFMATTDRIASRGTPTTPFPMNILWNFAPDDQRRLKHYPDLYVRPGGVPFGDASDSPLPPGKTDATISPPGVVLHISSLLDTVPIGAPVRVSIELRNNGRTAVLAPSALNMKTGCVTGRVIGPNGTAREFRPLILCLEQSCYEPLAPDQSVSHALTLLRGAAGALFPTVGLFKVVVEVTWEILGLGVNLTGETFVLITPPADEAHALTAKTMLSTPDAHLTLVLGGDGLEQGVKAIGDAVVNPSLRPHYAYVEARRLAERFRQRKPNLSAAATLLTSDAVVSPAEVERIVQWVARVPLDDEDDEPAKKIAAFLKSKIQTLSVPRSLADAVDALRV